MERDERLQAAAWSALRLLVAVAALCPGTLPPARAQLMEPLSYTNAPIGLNFLVTGYSHQWGNVLVDPSLPVQNVKATVDTALVGYARVEDFWGQSGTLALVAPYTRLTASGDVFDQAQSVTRTGLGDLIMRAAVNLYGAPALSLKEFSGYHQDTIVGVSLLVTAPSGQYYSTKLINIGTNRWTFRPEVGLSQALGPWTVEAAAGVTLFTNNDEFFGNNFRQQAPLYSIQGHAIYNADPRWWAAVDGIYYAGGRTTLNGSLANDLQSNTRWGATFAYNLDRHNSLKTYFSSGLTARTGTEFKIVGIAYQYRWGAGL